MSIFSEYPRKVVQMLHKIRFFIWDFAELLFASRDELTPPRSKSYLFGSATARDYLTNHREGGLWWAEKFVQLGKLKPDDRVLEVGSGIGRIAVGLIDYLNEDAFYRGFDINSVGVDWSKENITPKFPNFQFQLADVYNTTYNPNGKYQACDYKFPFPDQTFDFVYLTSVFTHMLPLDLENYLSEITRVMKPGAKCLITFFLMNPESMSFAGSSKNSRNFQKFDGYWSISEKVPEYAVAYDEQYIMELYTKVGLKIAEPIYYGSWCGRDKFVHYQDFIVACKE